MAKPSSTAPMKASPPAVPVQPQPAPSNPGRLEVFQAHFNPTPMPDARGSTVRVNTQGNT